MSDYSFLSIVKPTEGLYKDKGSRFLSFAMPIESEAEAKQQIAQARKKYHDARHVCFAYVLGTDSSLTRCSDDGEPSGTAGKPILNQILTQNITNILVIVVRYFGGILLGTNGLVIAYRTATLDALNKAMIVRCEQLVEKTVTVPYEQFNTLLGNLKKFDAVILDKQFDTLTTITFQISKQYEDRI